MTRAALLVLLALLGCSPADAETFDGRRAVIIDGDTFAIGSERFRILNIDAPETPGSRCERELVLGL
jgi:endonuclease YncB( thermonuclease family)